MMDLGKNAYYWLVGIVILTLGVGMTFYHYVEKLPWLDAYYFCVITLTTVGYGDISPKTDAGKLFTTFYLFIGIGIITGFITTTAKRRGKKIAERRLKNNKSDK